MLARDGDQDRLRGAAADASPSRSSRDAHTVVTGSALLRKLQQQAPAAEFTLQWMLESLSTQSYPALALLLGAAAAIPGICVPAGLLLLVPIVQALVGRPAPAFPAWIAQRPLPTDKLIATVQRAIPVLEFVEKIVHPRCARLLAAGRWIAPWAALALTLRLLIWPLPFGNVPPALIVSLMGLSDLEEDGLMLTIGLAAGLALLALEFNVLHYVVQEVIARIPIGS